MPPFRLCRKCGEGFRLITQRRVNCYTCRPAQPRQPKEEDTLAGTIACRKCAHALVCSAAYTGYACTLDRLRTCKPYDEKRLFKEGTP